MEDDDGDMDERSVPTQQTQMGSSVDDDRSSVDHSVAASVAETESEADWLMAAISEAGSRRECAASNPSASGSPQNTRTDKLPKSTSASHS